MLQISKASLLDSRNRAGAISIFKIRVRVASGQNGSFRSGFIIFLGVDLGQWQARILIFLDLN